MLRTPQLHESLLRLLSHALRHDPAAHFVEVDQDGWAGLEEVLLAIRCEIGGLRRLGKDELKRMLDAMLPQRFEIEGERIRALYGHSLSYVETGVERIPPTVLFHGTTERAWTEITKIGLQPMGRRFVHLTDDRDYADRVARAKVSERAAVLQVAAQQAYRSGNRFFQANEHVWLTNSAAPQFLMRQDEQSTWARRGEMNERTPRSCNDGTHYGQ